LRKVQGILFFIRVSESGLVQVLIKRSKNRKKTISARVIQDVMHVSAPVSYPEKKLEETIEKFKARFEKQRQKKELNSKINLFEVAQRLNHKYFDGEIEVESIEYSANQNSIYGNCTHQKRTIRISHHLAKMPEWVRDYVIIHEMAHIIEPNHGASFWKLVSRYELTERARGYLMAKGMEL